VIFAEANTRPVRATNNTVLPLAALKLALTVYLEVAARGALPALAGLATNPSEINPIVSNIINFRIGPPWQILTNTISLFSFQSYFSTLFSITYPILLLS
jgi:hypothetical protein